MPPQPLRRAFISRWYLTLVGLLITAALAFGAKMLVPAQYQAKSVTVLLPPSTTTSANPLTNLSSLAGLTDVLNQALTSPATISKVKHAGNVGTYTVANDISTNGPLVVVQSLSNTPAQASSLAQYVTDLVPSKLKEIQTSTGIISPKISITSYVINHVDKITVVKKNQTRALLVALAGGLLLTVLLVATGERIATRRRRDKRMRRPQPPVKRAPLPYTSKENAKAPAHMVHPLPDADGSRKESAKAAARRRPRRSRTTADAEHESITAGN